MVIFTRKETKRAIILKIVLAHLKNTSEVVAKITDQAVRGSFRKRRNFRFIYFFYRSFINNLQRIESRACQSVLVFTCVLFH